MTHLIMTSSTGELMDPTCASVTDPVSQVRVQRLQAGGLVNVVDLVAEEIPVALEFNGISQAVMLTTPMDLEDFAVGYSLTEGIIDSADDVYDCEVIFVENGIRIALQVHGSCFARLKEHRRNMAGRTGCGLCGVDSLSQVRRRLKPVERGNQESWESIQTALGNLSEFQPIFHQTGATHGAFWVQEVGKIAIAREDVGRHNAIDKLVGALARSGSDFSRGAVLMTSRASFEIVQKAASVGIGMVAAVSAPTALAVRVARELNVTLIGFMRGNEYVVYAPPFGLSEVR